MRDRGSALISICDNTSRRLRFMRLNAYVPDHGGKFNQWMGLIVAIAWMSFTARTEISVMTHSTLESDALDVCLIALASTERSVTVNAVMTRLDLRSDWKDIIDWHKAVLVSCLLPFIASAAEVEIWAVQALIANAYDSLEPVSASSLRR